MNTKHLKSKILDLAIRGKLVSQDSSEGNAVEFSKKSNNISENGIPFQIPENWSWCRLDQIANIERGGSPRPIADYLTTNDDGINWIKIGDTKKGDKYIVSVKEKIKPEGIRYSRFVHAGDFLLTNSMSFGRPYILKVDGCIHDGWLVFGNIDSCISPEFLFQLLSSPFIYQSFKLTAAGSTVKNLNIDRVKQVIFPLPPLSEQQKIVSAIEKAFEQIDIIEKNKLNLKTYIKQTKSKVLDLAIRGKLVPQDPSEGNAADLLKEHNDIPEDEIPFEIPENWCWCTGNEIFSPMTSKRPDGEEFKYIDIESVDNKMQKIHHPKILKTSKAPSRASRETKIGDIVFSMVRPYLKNIARISEDLGDCIASTGFFVCRPNKFLDSKYCYYLMISSYVVNGLNQFMKGDNSPSINSDDITDFIYPLPTIEEQKRIVERIEQIFEQLDILDKSLGE